MDGMSRFTPRLRPRENGSPSRTEPLTPPATRDGTPPRLRSREQVTAPTHGGSFRARLRDPLALAGIVLVLLALIGYLAVYESGTHRTPILVATQALPAGTVLSAGDVRTGQLAGDGPVLASLVPERDLAQVIGQRLSSAVPSGAPLPAGALAGREAQTSTLVLSIPEFDVTGTGLVAGDRVAVLATFGAGSGTASTRPVARGLEVLSVGEAGPNAQASTATVPVGVSVSDPRVSSSLALANEDAKLDVLVEGQGASTAAIPPASQGSGVP